MNNLLPDEWKTVNSFGTIVELNSNIPPTVYPRREEKPFQFSSKTTPRYSPQPHPSFLTFKPSNPNPPHHTLKILAPPNSHHPTHYPTKIFLYS